MCQANSHGPVAPCRDGCSIAELAQVTPVLVLLVIESVLKRKCLLRQLLISRIPGCTRKMGQSPSNAGYSMGKAAHSIRRIGIWPVCLPVLMFGPLMQ